MSSEYLSLGLQFYHVFCGFAARAESLPLTIEKRGRAPELPTSAATSETWPGPVGRVSRPRTVAPSSMTQFGSQK